MMIVGFQPSMWTWRSECIHRRAKHRQQRAEPHASNRSSRL